MNITLLGNNISTSALGFGCSGLMGSGSKAERLALLGTAFEEGVCHFDVAPYYGYGEAEAMLGEFVQSRRDRLTITTKFGIQPPKSNTGLRAITSIARKVAKLNPFLRKVLSKEGSKLIQTQAFSVGEAKSSLENSLRSLKTDYIDIYLLHDCKLANTESESLLLFLQNAVKEGKIRVFGIGTDINEVNKIVDSQPQFTKIVQFEHNIVEQNLNKLIERGNHSIITHRSIGACFQELQNLLENNQQITKEWSKHLDLDLRSPATLAQLMLNYATHTNTQGVVLFSSQKPERVRSNIRSVIESIYLDIQIEEFARLVKETL
jgi:D-threo-aldose 1-dehydrogenase